MLVNGKIKDMEGESKPSGLFCPSCQSQCMWKGRDLVCPECGEQFTGEEE